MTALIEGAPEARNQTPLSLLGQAVEENDKLRQENQRLEALCKSQRDELIELWTSKTLLQAQVMGLEIIAGRPRHEMHSVRVTEDEFRLLATERA